MSTLASDPALAAPEQPPASGGAPPGAPPERAPLEGAFQAELARTANAEGQQQRAGAKRSHAAAEDESGTPATTTGSGSIPREATAARAPRSSGQRRGERREKTSPPAGTGAASAGGVTTVPSPAAGAEAPGTGAPSAGAAGSQLSAPEASAQADTTAEPVEAPLARAATAASGDADPAPTMPSPADAGALAEPDPTGKDGGAQAESSSREPATPAPGSSVSTGPAHVPSVTEEASLRPDSPRGQVAELTSQPPAGGRPEASSTTASPKPGTEPRPDPALTRADSTPGSSPAADHANAEEDAASASAPLDAHRSAKSPTARAESSLKIADDADERESAMPAAAPDADAGSLAAASDTAVDGGSATSPASGAPPAYGVGLEQAIENMHVTIELAAREGLSQARIALEPEELGEIRIHLTQTAAGLITRVTAESPAAAQALALGHTELRQSLTSMGLSLARLQIGHHGQASADGSRHDSERSPQRTAGEVRSGAGTASEDPEPEDQSARVSGDEQMLQAASPTAGALIDVLV